MEIISHDDRTLKEHLNGLKEVILTLLKEKTQSFYKPDEFQKIVLALISYHDLAKASTYFQLYLANSLVRQKTGHRDYSNEDLQDYINKHKHKYVILKENFNLKEHSHFGSWMSHAFIDEENRYGLDAFLFAEIIKRHHGYLHDFTLSNINPENKIDELIEIGKNINFNEYKLLCDELELPFKFIPIDNILKSFKGYRFKSIENSLLNKSDSLFYFRTLFLYSLLLSADKGDVMLKDKQLYRQKIGSSCIDKYKKEIAKSTYSINNIREEAYNITLNQLEKAGDKNFYSVTLPTGLGKTFTAYKVALTIKERFCPEFRIIYCLPFTSIIEQNAIIFKKILMNYSLDDVSINVHHHLSAPKYSEEDSSYSEWEYFTEGWQNEITITTFVQFWDSIFAYHNKEIRKFHNLVNSIIILDEIQSIAPSLISALEFMMKNLARFFNTKFILVTATQPFILREKIIELAYKESEDYFFRSLNRTTINQSLLKKGLMNEEVLASIIEEQYRETNGSILIICNTIRYSQNLYELLSNLVTDTSVYYLSAAIIPHTREEIINNIKVKLANHKPTILVSTQVVEAGVDIDFDIVYRDFAPLSSINQGAGRCNRNGLNTTSTVYLFKSGKDKIYDPTILDITSIVLKYYKDEIPENEYFQLNQKYFTLVKSKIQEDSNISNSLIESVHRLRFEDVGHNKNYRLIKEEYKSNNFFIPMNDNAEKLWNKYLELLDIEEHFLRKREIKIFLPKLLQYVIKIPEYVYKPDQNEKAIIRDENWKDFYDKKLGYKKPEKELIIEII